ncbi:hypothetical protein GGI12_005911, partial [Dipsacomyces acuminosporus]
MLFKNSIVLLVATAIVAVSAFPAPPAKGARVNRPNTGTRQNRDIGRKIDSGMRRTEQAIGIGERLHDFWRQIKPKQDPQQAEPVQYQRRELTPPGKRPTGAPAPKPKPRYTLSKPAPKLPALNPDHRNFGL